MRTTTHCKRIIGIRMLVGVRVDFAFRFAASALIDFKR
jgi:hypothetical protein